MFKINKNNRVKNFQKKNLENKNNGILIAKKRPIFVKQNLKKILGVISVFIAIGVIFFIFFSNYFSVSNISFERKNFSFNPENISQDLEKFLGKNIFFINTFRIEKILKEKNPQFKNIKIKKIYPETIHFEVFDYKNIFKINTFFTKKNKDTGVIEKFLQNFLISQSGQLKYLPKETGTGGTKNELKNIFIKEDLLKKLEVGENITTGEILSNIQKINSYIETQEKITVDSIFFWPNGKEIHFNTKNGNFHFTLSKDINEQIKKISYFKESKGIQNLDKKEFEYLDLRIAEKIIYK